MLIPWKKEFFYKSDKKLASEQKKGIMKNRKAA